MADSRVCTLTARAKTGDVFSTMPFGDPHNTASAVLRLVDMDQPPLRLLLGAHALPLVLKTYEDRTREWQAFREIADQAQ